MARTVAPPWSASRLFAFFMSPELDIPPCARFRFSNQSSGQTATGTIRTDNIGYDSFRGVAQIIFGRRHQ